MRFLRAVVARRVSDKSFAKDLKAYLEAAECVVRLASEKGAWHPQGVSWLGRWGVFYGWGAKLTTSSSDF